LEQEPTLIVIELRFKYMI